MPTKRFVIYGWFGADDVDIISGRMRLLVEAYGGSLGGQIMACRALGIDPAKREWPPEIVTRLRP